MNSLKYHPSARLLFGWFALCLIFATPAYTSDAQPTFPQYDHVFLLIMENEGSNQVVGNQFAPILNALAQDYAGKRTAKREKTGA